MTVKELIKELKKYPQDANIQIGCILCGKHGIVKVHSDAERVHQEKGCVIIDESIEI